MILRFLEVAFIGQCLGKDFIVVQIEEPGKSGGTAISHLDEKLAFGVISM